MTDIRVAGMGVTPYSRGMARQAEEDDGHSQPASPSTATTAVLLFGFSTAPMYPLLVLTAVERTSAAAADRMIGFEAPPRCRGHPTADRSCHRRVGRRFRAGDRTAVPDRRAAAHRHAESPTPLARCPQEGRLLNYLDFTVWRIGVTILAGVIGAKSGLTARRAPAQQHPGRTGIDHAVFRDTTFGGAVAADVLPLELTRCVCIGID
jgi:hypothetical protein